MKKNRLIFMSVAILIGITYSTKPTITHADSAPNIYVTPKEIGKHDLSLVDWTPPID